MKEFLLGDNPFIGVSHLAQVKARESRELGLENLVKVVIAAYESGATGFTFSTHLTNLKILKTLSDVRRDILNGMNFYPLVPYGMSYVRRSNKAGVPGLGLEVLRNALRSIHRINMLAKACFEMDPSILLSIQLENDLRPYMKLLQRERIKAALLHEVLTEVIVAHEAVELYDKICEYFKDVLGLSLGLETRNICKLREFIEEHFVEVPYIMTPLNKLGYQMTPNKLEAEKCIHELSKKSRIIAINVLASGAITLNEAIDYLRKFNIYGVAIGTSKMVRAKRNFATLRNAFRNK